MDKKRRYIEINIKKQGAPIADYAYIERQGDEIALVVIDMKSKGCIIRYTHGSLYDMPPSVVVGADEHSLYLSGEFGRDETTEIELPEFIGWSIWAESEGRYDLYLCLIKNSEGD